ncbi:hypothetical protein BJX76DRAFT_366412 [Aspergillus varians]
MSSGVQHFLNLSTKQLRNRFSPFNVPELQSVAASSVEANRCVEVMKLAEGSIPHPIAGPRYYATASEVATILEIPNPQVFAWSADVNNPVQSEYIIMEEAPGVKLEDVWNKLSLEQRITVMKDLVSWEKKMLSISFNSYGNLYYTGETIPGATPAEVIEDMPTEIKCTVMRQFVIGPAAERGYWNSQHAVMNVGRGPWKRPQDYAASPAHQELKWIKQQAVPKLQDNPLMASATQNSPSSHISLLQWYLEVAPYLLPGDPDLVAPHLWHTDLHSGNIFVENGHLSSVIDWQGTRIAPLILQARHPRLVSYNGDLVLKAPANFKDLEPNAKSRVQEQMSRSIILYLYEKQISKEVPLLDKAIRFHHGRTRCEPIQFVGDTWDDDILPLRESLIRVEKYWNELGFDFPCPIHFTGNELRIHAEESEGWNDVQDFCDSVSDIISRDGWTPNDRYDALALFTELRETGLRSMIGKQREDFKR